MTNTQQTPTANDLVTPRAALAQSATALMALTVRKVFADVATITVEVTENGGRLVAVYSTIPTQLWMTTVDDDLTGDLAEVDDLLWCARIHRDLDHATLPGWTAASTAGHLWDIEVSDVTTRPLGNGLAWPQA